MDTLTPSAAFVRITQSVEEHLVAERAAGKVELANAWLRNARRWSAVARALASNGREDRALRGLERALTRFAVFSEKIGFDAYRTVLWKEQKKRLSPWSLSESPIDYWRRSGTYVKRVNGVWYSLETKSPERGWDGRLQLGECNEPWRALPPDSLLLWRIEEWECKHPGQAIKDAEKQRKKVSPVVACLRAGMPVTRLNGDWYNVGKDGTPTRPLHPCMLKVELDAWLAKNPDAYAKEAPTPRPLATTWWREGLRLLEEYRKDRRRRQNALAVAAFLTLPAAYLIVDVIGDAWRNMPPVLAVAGGAIAVAGVAIAWLALATIGGAFVLLVQAGLQVLRSWRPEERRRCAAELAQMYAILMTSRLSPAPLERVFALAHDVLSANRCAWPVAMVRVQRRTPRAAAALLLRDVTGAIIEGGPMNYVDKHMLHEIFLYSVHELERAGALASEVAAAFRDWAERRILQRSA